MRQIQGGREGRTPVAAVAFDSRAGDHAQHAIRREPADAMAVVLAKPNGSIRAADQPIGVVDRIRAGRRTGAGEIGNSPFLGGRAQGRDEQESYYSTGFHVQVDPLRLPNGGDFTASAWYQR